METLDPNSNPNSPNKRLKSETLTLIPSTPSLIDKGKAPIIADNDGDNEDGYDSPANSSPENCGICFLEEGKTFRGLIDSCDHHFCFICIIEWSKIESRCPLCRERFSTIRRVRKDGSFIGQGSVRVPVRDQIYDPFGEPVDPYAQAKCSICNNTTDECLLLLCDLCDSASHTYCVGLGATVPEGDWFCRDCALLRAEQEDSEMGCDVVTSTVSPQVDEPPSTSASISIFDIVRDPKVPDSGTSRLLKLVSRKATKFSSSAIASDQPSIASARNVPDLRDNFHPAAELSGSSARTLRNCRNVHRHINVLRENWGAFRTGSLNFSSALSDSFGKAGQQKNVVGTSLKGSGKLQSSSTCSSETKVADSLHDARHYKESYNVDRAWKLMNIAKTVQWTDKSKSTSKIVKKNGHSIKRDKLLMKSSVSGRKDLTSPVLEEQRPTHNISGRPAQSSGKHHFGSFVSLAARTPGSKHQNSRVANLSMPTELQTASKDDISYNRTCFASSNKVQGRLSTILGDGSARSASSCGSIAVASDVSFAGLQRGKISARPVKQAVDLKIYSSSTKELQTSVQTDICRDKPALHSHASLRRGLSNNFDEQNSCACSTAYNLILDGFDASHVKLEGKKISACPGKVGDKITSKDSKDDEAKGEIQSLVKLNLKLLCKDKRLGVDAFKEIARLSTHTILASCGFEHRKIVRPLPRLVCHHGDQTQQIYKSTIVPSSCRECFYVFVKDVVNSIMSEKLNNAEIVS